MTWLNYAKAQKKLIKYLILNLVCVLFVVAVDAMEIWKFLPALIAFCIFTLQAKLMYEASHLMGNNEGWSYFYGFTSFIPGLGFRHMNVLNIGCSSVLKSSGITFGLFGVSNKLIQGAEEI